MPAIVVGVLTLVLAGSACVASASGLFGLADMLLICSMAGFVAGFSLSFVKFFSRVYPLTGWTFWSVLVDRVNLPAEGFYSRVLRAVAPPPRISPAI